MSKYLILIFQLTVYVNLSAQDQMYDVCPLKVGEEVPSSVKVVQANGESIGFGDLLHDGKSIVVFYRGGWCPYCTRHLSALGQIKDEIDSLGYKLYGVTLDQFDSLGVSQLKSQTDYKLLSDNKAELTAAFGLAWKVDDKNYVKYRDKFKMDIEEWSGEKHRILPVPAVYVIEDGVVLYNYVNPNYSIRLKPETLLAILISI